MIVINMITGQESRAARAFLNWSVKDLALKAGMSTTSIANFETTKLENGLRRDRYFRIADIIAKVFKNEGISFAEEEDCIIIKIMKKPAQVNDVSE